MNTSPSVRIVALVGCLVILASMGALLTEADVRPSSTLTVTTTSDAGPGSLRDALANADDGDEIAFALSTPATITLTSGELVIEDDLTIIGPGAELLAISGGGASRVINVVEPVSLAVSGVTIRDGYVVDENGGGMLLAPGCCLTLTASALVTNTAEQRSDISPGGGLYASDCVCVVSDTLVSDNSWGIALDGGTSLIENCTIVGNLIGAGTDPMGGTAEIVNCTVLSNTQGLGAGSGTTVRGGRIAGNEVGLGAGGTTAGPVVITDALFEQNDRAAFIQHWLGETFIQGCTIRNNLRNSGGGIIWVSSKALHMTDCLLEHNSGSRGVLYTYEEGSESVSITNCQFISNSGPYQSGAIESHVPMTLTSCLFQGNHAGQQGGAITQEFSGSTLAISGCTFISNTAGLRGAAIANRASYLTLTHCTILSNTAGETGGAIYNLYDPDALCLGRVSLYDTHLQGNRCITGTGGAIATLTGPVQAERCTMVDNVALNGGAIHSENGRVTLTDCSLEANHADEDGGGLYVTGADRLNLTDTDVVSNTAQFGGGILLKEMGEVEIVGGRIGGNVAQERGGGVSVGAESQDYECDSLHINGTLMDQNRAVCSGGASPFAGGAVSGDGVIRHFRVHDCDILSNQCEDQGGAFGASCELMELSDSLFEGNRSVGPGGAVANWGGTVITNTRFVSNTSGYSGGGAYLLGESHVSGCHFERNEAESACGGLYTIQYPLYMTNTVFVENRAADSAAFRIQTGTVDHVTALRNVAREDCGACTTMGPVTITNSSFVSNTASTIAGALKNVYSLRIVDSLFQQNSTSESGAGAVSSHGSLVLSGTQFISNTGATDAGAVMARESLAMDGCYAGGNESGESGGAVTTRDSATIASSTFIGNSSAQDGGAMYINGLLTITDSQILSNTCEGLGGGAFIWGDAHISGSRFEGNSAGDAWGALGVQTDRLEVVDSQFIGNHAGSVGGMIIGEGTLDRVLLQGNSADNAIGAISAGGPVTITNSSIVSNTSSTMGALLNSFDLALENTTIAYNTSTGDGPGGLNLVGPALITNCTIAHNEAITGTGGIHDVLGGTTLINTIVADNTSAAGLPDLSGAYTSGGYNLIDIADGATGFVAGVNGDLVGSAAAPLDPLLGSLGDYGGETPTLPLLPGSPAIDAAGYAAPALDQRGAPRVGRADMGAFEAQGFVLAAASGDGQSAPLGEPFGEALTVRVASAKGDPVDGGVVTFAAPEIGASALLSATTAQIVDGLASVSATANGIAGTYEVEARARGARPERIWRPEGLMLEEPTVPVTPTATSTSEPTATPTATLEPPVEEPLAFTLTNVDGTVTPDEGVWLPLIVRR